MNQRITLKYLMMYRNKTKKKQPNINMEKYQIKIDGLSLLKTEQKIKIKFSQNIRILDDVYNDETYSVNCNLASNL